MAIACIDGLWVTWLTIWFVAALRVKPTVYRQPRWQRVLFMICILAAAIAMQQLPGLRRWLFFPGPLTEALGVSLCAAGLGWAVWARIHLGRNWSGFVTVKQDHELIQSGPYRITRHPIYTGVLLAIFGTLLALAPTYGGALGMALACIGFYIKLRQEEAVMTRTFPEAYPAYRRRVRAALVPFLI
jgi:protein-S-isoprenylcysteine O-methyltransferase Ste14